ncbi:DUF2306 domain-containing protein [Nocardioides jiangxiensis]|uniref:DUF2306 domain-containing protein n=1 Tax=Nocardioides jiangxiensis TaxID=3064524 RepID=A0ABT9B437_9ACTN|nr:DUF2306 domain-containing protein [Nocardioides sp. WY-20]MDO7867918.1 DUF2306 domain-containing protein [Nocardioides sp. WY-20]
MATLATRTRTTAGVVLAVLVAFYAPMTLTYFWNGPSGPNLQDHVFEFLVSPRFAFGLGSGHDVRADGSAPHFATFATTYTTMWLHSTIGTLTLVTGLSQFSERLRRRNMALHRTLGKVFILGCLGVFATASSYLLQTDSRLVFSGPAFEEVLWLLAAGTAGLAILAFVSIRRRDLVAHRELATAAFALICSAGWLRAMWLSVEPVAHMGKEMDNLFGIQFAAAFLITCAMVYVRRFWRGQRGADSPLATGRAVRVAAATGALGVLVLAVVAARTDWYAAHPSWFVAGPWPVILGAALPWALHTSWLGWMAARAGRRGDVAAHAAWRTYLVGGLAGPAVGALGLGFARVVHGMPLQQAWFMVGYLWGVGLVLAYAAHATLTTRWAKRRPVAAPVSAEPVAA